MPQNAPLEIINADQLNDTELAIDFSDGTTAVFTVDQLASLAPDRYETDGGSPE